MYSLGFQTHFQQCIMCSYAVLLVYLHAGAVGTAWMSPDEMNKLSTGARNSLQGLSLLCRQWNEMADLEIGFSAPPCRGNLIREVLCASFDKNRNEFQRKCLAGPSSEQRRRESKRCWGVEVCSVLEKAVVSVVPEGCVSHGEHLGGRRVVGEDILRCEEWACVCLTKGSAPFPGDFLFSLRERTWDLRSVNEVTLQLIWKSETFGLGMGLRANSYGTVKIPLWRKTNPIMKIPWRSFPTVL